MRPAARPEAEGALEFKIGCFRLLEESPPFHLPTCRLLVSAVPMGGEPAESRPPSNQRGGIVSMPLLDGGIDLLFSASPKADMFVTRLSSRLRCFRKRKMAKKSSAMNATAPTVAPATTPTGVVVDEGVELPTGAATAEDVPGASGPMLCNIE